VFGRYRRRAASKSSRCSTFNWARACHHAGRRAPNGKASSLVDPERRTTSVRDRASPAREISSAHSIAQQCRPPLPLHAIAHTETKTKKKTDTLAKPRVNIRPELSQHSTRRRERRRGRTSIQNKSTTIVRANGSIIGPGIHREITTTTTTRKLKRLFGPLRSSPLARLQPARKKLRPKQLSLHTIKTKLFLNISPEKQQRG
jgi:hypothetical protein